MMLPNRRISWQRIAIFLIVVPLSAAFAFFLQPKYHNNANAITVLATVFSILAGFLIAVMAMAADVRSLRGPSWRHDVAYLDLIRRDLLRHKMMFFLYLIILSLAFIGAVDLPWPGDIQTWMERVVLFLGVIAMALSFRLPGYLTRRHLESLEQLIRERQDAQTK